MDNRKKRTVSIRTTTDGTAALLQVEGGKFTLEDYGAIITTVQLGGVFDAFIGEDVVVLTAGGSDITYDMPQGLIDQLREVFTDPWRALNGHALDPVSFSPPSRLDSSYQPLPVTIYDATGFVIDLRTARIKSTTVSALAFFLNEQRGPKAASEQAVQITLTDKYLMVGCSGIKPGAIPPLVWCALESIALPVDSTADRAVYLPLCTTPG